MKIVKSGRVPEIQDLPEGNIVMFFAEIHPRLGYCVVFGPEEKCMPKEELHVELWAAKIAFGKEGEEMRVVDVRHGHKFTESMGGGGMVETKRGVKESATIFFRRPGYKRLSSIEALIDGQEFCGRFHEIFTVI